MDTPLDPNAADTLAVLADHLSGPMAGGVVMDDWPLDATGRASISVAAPGGLLMVGLVQPTLRAEILVTVTPDPNDPAAEVAEPLRFPSWTEELSFLPAMSMNSTRAFAVTASRNGEPVLAADLAGLVRLRLVRGNIGRFLHLLKREAPRLRREAAAILASRRLVVASGQTLDRIGFDLSAARFIAGNEREDDAGYRRRLALLRPFAAATPAAVRTRLDPGLDVTEQPTGLAVAVRLVGVGASAADATQRRDTWLAGLTASRLADPTAAVAADAFLPSSWRSARAARAERLAAMLTFEAGAQRLLAEPVLGALDRLSLMAQAAGADLRLTLKAAPDPVDPAIPLGLALVVANLTKPQRQALATQVPGGFDADDPSSAGLFRHLGFLGVRRLAERSTLLTTQPGALLLNAPDTIDLTAARQAVLTMERPPAFGAPADPAAALVNGRPAQRALFRAAVLAGPRPRLTQEGNRARLRPTGPGVLLLVAHALLRTGGTDPFEARVLANEPALRLDLAGWERLVETLRHIRPIGIAIDTWALREGAVQIDGAPVDPRDTRLRRGTRPWRRPRNTASLPIPSDEGS